MSKFIQDSACIRASQRLLSSEHWINDYVINDYFQLLEQSRPHILAVSSFHVGTNKPWLKTLKADTEIKKILIPVNHHGKHWYLTMVDLDRRQVLIYDSMDEITPETYMEEYQKFVCHCGTQYAKQVGIETLTPEKMDSPKQEGASDCGVFTMAAAEFLSRLEPPPPPGGFNFSQKNILSFRLQIFDTLFAGTGVPELEPLEISAGDAAKAFKLRLAKLREAVIGPPKDRGQSATSTSGPRYRSMIKSPDPDDKGVMLTSVFYSEESEYKFAGEYKPFEETRVTILELITECHESEPLILCKYSKGAEIKRQWIHLLEMPKLVQRKMLTKVKLAAFMIRLLFWHEQKFKSILTKVDSKQKYFISLVQFGLSQ